MTFSLIYLPTTWRTELCLLQHQSVYTTQNYVEINTHGIAHYFFFPILFENVLTVNSIIYFTFKNVAKCREMCLISTSVCRVAICHRSTYLAALANACINCSGRKSPVSGNGKRTGSHGYLSTVNCLLRAHRQNQSPRKYNDLHLYYNQYC